MLWQLSPGVRFYQYWRHMVFGMSDSLFFSERVSIYNDLAAPHKLTWELIGPQSATMQQSISIVPREF